jgi:CheY-like chemotaxis protein
MHTWMNHQQARKLEVGCKILIVEDDPGIREILCLALELEGYAVATAADGHEGLETLKVIGRPCLILLDLMMPVMNGWQFAEAIGKDVTLAQIPIAVVTAYAERASSIKAQAVIRKPVDMDVLLKLVKEHC